MNNRNRVFLNINKSIFDMWVKTKVEEEILCVAHRLKSLSFLGQERCQVVGYYEFTFLFTGHSKEGNVYRSVFTEHVMGTIKPLGGKNDSIQKDLFFYFFWKCQILTWAISIKALTSSLSRGRLMLENISSTFVSIILLTKKSMLFSVITIWSFTKKLTKLFTSFRVITPLFTSSIATRAETSRLRSSDKSWGLSEKTQLEWNWRFVYVCRKKSGCLGLYTFKGYKDLEATLTLSFPLSK